MKFIQTFYLSDSQNALTDTFGWISPEYNLMGWTLSCLQLKKYYSDVHLYTTDIGAETLVNKLKLPYDHIHTIHNNFTPPHPLLWALAKIFTYSVQSDSFLHVDGDVFIFNPFPEHLINQQLIAQNEEIATDYYISTQKELIRNFTYFPKVVEMDFSQSHPIHAVNAGILGGSDIEFYKEYTALAFEYVNKNLKSLNLIDANKFNIFFEQHLFYCLATCKRKQIAYLLKDVFQDNKFSDMGNFWEVPIGKSYLHLLGEYKRNDFICVQMAGILRQYYPEYYYRIISLFKKNNLSLKHDYYSHLACSNENDIKKYFFLSKAAYSSYEKKEDKKYECSSFDEIMNRVGLYRENIYLNEVIRHTDSQDGVNQNELNNDYANFTKQIAGIVFENDCSISRGYLYGRDVEAIDWYAMVFGEEDKISNKKLVKSEGVKIFFSHYNWGEFWAGFNLAGVRYYKNLQLKGGAYYNMVVPEAFDPGFSLYDIEELEVSLLNLISNPLTINELLIKAMDYFESEAVENSLEEINLLVLTLLKQLILKKAIQPLKMKQ